MQQNTATDNQNTHPSNVTLSSFAVKHNKRGHKKAKGLVQGLKDFFMGDGETQSEADTPGMPAMLQKAVRRAEKEEEVPVFGEMNKKHDDPHKVEKMKKGVHEAYCELRSKFVNSKMPQITTNWCNFGSSYETIKAYQSLCSAHFGKLTPLKLRVDCYLYHGCDLLDVEEKSIKKSSEFYFNQNVAFNQWLFFDLKYCQLPEKTRITFNIVLVFQEINEPELVIGTVSTNLFNKAGKFQSGRKELNIWPFYDKAERLGCMKEWNGLTTTQSKTVSENPKLLHLYFARLIVFFEVFVNPMFYSSRDDKKIERYSLTKTQVDNDIRLKSKKPSEDPAKDQEIQNKQLADLKKHFKQNPLTAFNAESKE